MAGKKRIIILFVYFFFTLKQLEAQQLPLNNSWSFGMGPAYSSLSINSNSRHFDSGNQLTMIQEESGLGRSLGFSLHFGKNFLQSKRTCIQTELSLLHARRKSSIEENLTASELIHQVQGIVQLNNLYLQFLVAPRFQFGLFNRYYVSAGPYGEINLLNFSRYNGQKTIYYEMAQSEGELLLTILNEPIETIVNKKVKIRNWDFGGFIALGTLLALPGKDHLKVEIRYSRGAFRVSELPALRQNRFQILFFYNLVQSKFNKDYRAY